MVDVPAPVVVEQRKPVARARAGTRGAFAFTAQGGAEGRFDEASKTLYIDLDGNGTADMAFLLPGFPPDGFDGNSVLWA